MYLPQHTTLRLEAKALQARVHCVCRYSPTEPRQRQWKLMKGGMNSHNVDKKRPKTCGNISVYTAHTPEIA